MDMKASVIPVTPYQQNCSLIWCAETKKGAFVDPGGEIEKLLGAAAAEGIEIEKILVTHGHLDHAGAVGELAEQLGVPIEGPHKEDSYWIDQITQQCADSGFPPTKGFTPTRWLVDGDKVTVGNIEMDVIHCPGHTPGHVVFFNPKSNVAFVGDVIFQGSIGRTDFPKGNHQDLIDAITQKLWPLGDDVTFVPGHGGFSTFGNERQTNPYVGDAALAK